MTREVRSAATLALFVAACFGAAAVGGLATSSSVKTWYPQLQKPPWTPPAGVFGPVWTVLYLAMAVAAWLVWRRTGWAGGRRPLGWFAAQLALNAVWSHLFFGLRSPAAGLVGIVLLWLAILGTLATFRPVSRFAALLLIPYLAWVSFAAALNFAIWQLNARA